jgi:hypothetical protein
VRDSYSGGGEYLTYNAEADIQTVVGDPMYEGFYTLIFGVPQVGLIAPLVGAFTPEEIAQDFAAAGPMTIFEHAE